jgi:hypothetical protein
LYREWFAALVEAKVVIEQWRHFYNTATAQRTRLQNASRSSRNRALTARLLREGRCRRVICHAFFL